MKSIVWWLSEKGVPGQEGRACETEASTNASGVRQEWGAGTPSSLSETSLSAKILLYGGLWWSVAWIHPLGHIL